ncbi:hypothetical protein L804_05725 [Cryptococcus deuterogattii 2001/935-1]|nr:hypothetical protein L804_05725 [Cryptococcus deuterogattii 2001/935-1]
MDKGLLDQTLFTGVRGQGSGKRRRQAEDGGTLRVPFVGKDEVAEVQEGKIEHTPGGLVQENFGPELEKRHYSSDERLKDQRDMLDSAFRTSVILPKCREYNIIQRAVSASLLVPMLYDHTDSKFKSEPVLQEGENMGTEAGYQLSPILKSLSGLRERPGDQCWAYEEQPWWSETLTIS